MIKRFALTGVFAALFAAFLFAGASLSKDSDDETIYTALAAKISAAGLTRYNLHGISIDPAGDFWKLEAREDGNLLTLLKASGPVYYDVPLYFNPPLFPMALAASHAVLNHSLHFLLLKRSAAPGFRYEQVYAAFPTAVCAVLMLAGVFRLGRRYFGTRAGLLAALLCLVSPVFLVASFKVWSDLMAAALILWSYLFWREGKGTPAEMVFSGVLFGLAVLTRTSSLFALPLFFIRKPRFLWSVPALLLVAPWFAIVAGKYGTPLYFPEAGSAKDSLEWLQSISKPWYFYLLDLAYLSPYFAAGLLAWRRQTRRLHLWFVLFLFPLSALLFTSKPLGLEDRYLLPCYPALAVLTAGAVLSLKKPYKAAAVAVLAVACLWSLRLAVPLVLSRESLHLVAW